MAKFSGVVFKLYPSNYGGGSFRLENDQTYYNSQGPLPANVGPGVSVEFEAGDLRGKGRQIQGTVNVVQRAAASAPATSGASLGERESSIQYQAARNSALEMVGLLLQGEAVKLGDKLSGRVTVLEALVDKYTADFYADTLTLEALNRVSIAAQEAEEAAEAAPKPAKKKAPAPVVEDEDLPD